MAKSVQVAVVLEVCTYCLPCTLEEEEEEEDEKEMSWNEGTLMQRHAIDFAEGSFFC